MSELKQKFEEAVNYVQSGKGSGNPSNEQKLKFYALYKQATDGDVKGKKPGITDFVGRAKFNAWSELKGTSSDQAMESYIQQLETSR